MKIILLETWVFSESIGYRSWISRTTDCFAFSKSGLYIDLKYKNIFYIEWFLAITLSYRPVLQYREVYFHKRSGFPQFLQPLDFLAWSWLLGRRVVVFLKYFFIKRINSSYIIRYYTSNNFFFELRINVKTEFWLEVNFFFEDSYNFLENILWLARSTQ